MKNSFVSLEGEIIKEGEFKCLYRCEQKERMYSKYIDGSLKLWLIVLGKAAI